MRLRPELALVSVVGVALAATAALGGTSRVGVTATYKLVFQGSGRATSTYPPRPDGTVFTSSISWTLVYEVTVDKGGRISEVRTVGGRSNEPPWPQLHDAAIAALKQYKYAKTVVRGAAAPVCLMVSLNVDLR